MTQPNASSKSAMKACMDSASVREFGGIMAAWRIGDHDAALLLGTPSDELYLSFKENTAQADLEDEALTRISLVILIHRALHTLFGMQLADEWVKLPNRGPLFNGATPLAYMLSEGIPGMVTVRRKLEADCQAHYL